LDNLGDRIRKLRERSGLSLRELEEKINISYSHLSRIENNKKKPNLELLETLAKFYDVDMPYFFGGTRIKTPKQLEPLLNKHKEWIAKLEGYEEKDLTFEEIQEIADFILKQKGK
jgi:transcriptional regulator with XRE-family HTH domain